MSKETATVYPLCQTPRRAADEKISVAVTSFPERNLAMTRVVGSFARAVMTASLLAMLATSVPVASASPNQLAQATPAPVTPAQPAPAASPQPAQTAPGKVHRGAAHTRTQLVEIMISNMRTKLQISPTEQSQFDAVAGVMRANATVMEALLDERTNDTDRSAVASLHWYQKLTEAHAAALKNFTPAFDTLYATLSESQRKAADAMFLRLGEPPFTPKSR